jgi:hypothetical protein
LGTHVASLLYFLDTGILSVTLRTVEPLCWPYFESCWEHRFASTDQVAAALLIFLLLIVAAAVTSGAGARRTFTVLLLVLHAAHAHRAGISQSR